MVSNGGSCGFDPALCLNQISQHLKPLERPFSDGVLKPWQGLFRVLLRALLHGRLPKSGVGIQ